MIGIRFEGLNKVMLTLDYNPPTLAWEYVAKLLFLSHFTSVGHMCHIV